MSDRCLFRKATLLFALLSLAVAGCGAGATQGGMAKSDLLRQTAPQVDLAELQALVEGNTAFALDLFQAIREGEGNLFYSPYSISLALAMTYAGARGTTEEEMARVLHFTLSQESLHPAFNALDLELLRRAEPIRTPDGEVETFRLNIANSLWGQKDYQFLDPFLNLLALNYGAGIRLVDFINATEEARQLINQWVEEETEDKIKDLIPLGELTPATVLVLANAIYFNAPWLFPFDQGLTTDGPFALLDGGQVTVPTMRLQESLAYAEGPGYQAVELPYSGGKVAMDVLLPAEGQFEAFEASLNPGTLSQILSGLNQVQVDLSMPKFEYESSFGLASVLAAMGMPSAFGDADFSGMDGTRSLFIGQVLHKAFVAVDEEGTEAAAATAVIMELSAMPEPGVEMRIDRPFFFLIRDTQTGTILFLGRVLNPAQ